jgi:uncharacterized protein
MNRHIVLAGGSGFLGSTLANHFKGRGWDVTILTRACGGVFHGVRRVHWDAMTPGAWCRELEGASALINLCGRSVNCRYTAGNRRRILESRTVPTRLLGQAVSQCAEPPEVWLNLSTATIYRHTLNSAWDERGEIGSEREAKDAFSIEVATAWEEAFDGVVTPRTRKLALRTAMVLADHSNSVLPMLRRLVRLGLGGRMGSGRQFVSWVHERDFCRALEWLIERRDMKGVFNVAAPEPVTNAQMMRKLRARFGCSLGLPAFRWMLEIGAFFLRTETELVIKSRCVVPGRLLSAGFKFDFPDFAAALGELALRPALR